MLLLFFGDEHSDPRRPVPTQFEEVIEVHETGLFELVDEFPESYIVGNRPDQNKPTVDAKLIGRKIEAFIDRLPSNPRALVRIPANEKH